MTVQGMAPLALFTSSLNKGQALLSETRLLALHWQPGLPPRTLADEALRTGYLGRATEKRVRDVVSVFRRRYLSDYLPAAAALNRLYQAEATRGSRELFDQVALLHTAIAHPELGAFLTEVYWPQRFEGREGMTMEAATEFLISAQRTGRTATQWTEGLTERTGRRLMGTLTEFGLLSKPDRAGRRRFPGFHLLDGTLLYLAHWLREQIADATTLAHHPAWNLLGVRHLDVLPTLRRLGAANYFTLLTVGDLTRLEWRLPSALIFLDDYLNGDPA